MYSVSNSRHACSVVAQAVVDVQQVVVAMLIDWGTRLLIDVTLPT